MNWGNKTREIPLVSKAAQGWSRQPCALMQHSPSQPNSTTWSKGNREFSPRKLFPVRDSTGDTQISTLSSHNKWTEKRCVAWYSPWLLEASPTAHTSSWGVRKGPALIQSGAGPNVLQDLGGLLVLLLHCRPVTPSNAKGKYQTALQH